MLQDDEGQALVQGVQDDQIAGAENNSESRSELRRVGTCPVTGKPFHHNGLQKPLCKKPYGEKSYAISMEGVMYMVRLTLAQM